MTENAGTPPSRALQEKIRVGLIQTDVSIKSWEERRLTMRKDAARHAWEMLRSELIQLSRATRKPDIVIAPEVALPIGYDYELRRIVSMMGVPLIVGRELSLDPCTGNAINRALVLVPRGWPQPNGRGTPREFAVGKTYGAREELDHINSCGLEFGSDATCWLFEGGRLGRMAVFICYDLMDIQRLAIYRGEIHHLLVVSYNKDIDTFVGLAQTACKLLCCNVVIANTGHYGGSIAVTPYHTHYRRIRFQSLGPYITSAQSVDLPLRSLDEWQAGREQASPPTGDEFKSLAAGFEYRPSQDGIQEIQLE